MKRPRRYSLWLLPLLLIFVWAMPVGAGILVQCPEDTDGVDTDGDGIVNNDVVCIHLTSSDGFTVMADEVKTEQYIFSFGRVEPIDMPVEEIVPTYSGKSMFPAPTIELKQGQELYLTLTNVGMSMRPDLFDSHTVHWHGFPNAASVFDGVPEVSPSAAMMASQPYYYKAVKEGTYFYHCHVEASEHMQMGMIGNLWVHPMQNNLPSQTFPNGFEHISGNKYAYNDADGSTYYDKEYPVQLTTFDAAFHDANLTVQPLPFALMEDDYFMINGRGYPDTINPDPIFNNTGEYAAQIINTLITATTGQKILLRLNNVSTTDLITVATTLGVPMRVVGRGAELLRGSDPDGDGPQQGKNTSYEVSTLNVGGGQAYDVIIDTAGVLPGTYFLYTSNLQFLSNNTEERGGIMTEIVIN